MPWDLTIAAILVIGATVIALLALGSRVALVRAVGNAHQRAARSAEELAKLRKISDERQAHDAETIARLQNRIIQQGQMLRALQDDLDKFINQNRTMRDVQVRSEGRGPSEQETKAVELREQAIRHRLRSMLHEFKSVTESLKDSDPAQAA
ncbi:MAG: hypothetical protein AMXMBFR58_32320 [Phycisphaerae bacterium]|nr:hypothetical protein [Phycisphaerales bacterium]MCK6476152.1 hypothetical protein [Phycisphaerales bacterium]